MWIRGRDGGSRDATAAILPLAVGRDGYIQVRLGSDHCQGTEAITSDDGNAVAGR